MIEVDTTSSSNFIENSENLVSNFVKSQEYLKNLEGNGFESLSYANVSQNLSERHAQERFVCDVCGGKVLLGKVQIESHLKSSGHRRTVKRQRRLEQKPVDT